MISHSISYLPAEIPLPIPQSCLAPPSTLPGPVGPQPGGSARASSGDGARQSACLDEEGEARRALEAIALEKSRGVQVGTDHVL